ncbi:WXG100 family type VII secretion target [Kitasatospora sp. NPDC057940]|uniref:WXG100 family type VII secretion target n=1 Tax=Kitasatospora sp. NPDC057940 TaxID=3346285 RepID=UPI0036DB2154
MDFGNIQLHHETVEQSAAELRQAGNLMHSNLEELMGKLRGVIDGGHFQGVAATAFEELSRVVAANESQMDKDIEAAAGTLTKMHDIMTESDYNAGKQF